MKKMIVRMFGFAAALVMTAGMLSAGALALEDCKHPELKKGYCADCEKQYVAVVDGTYYETIKSAVTAAERQEDKAVTLLADLKNKTLQLGEVYLVVGEESVSIEKCTLTGEGTDAVVVNRGTLTLLDSKVTNEDGDYALLNCGGTLTLKGAVLEASRAQVSVEGGKLKLDAIPEGDVLYVENALPGEFAAATGADAVDAVKSWIKNSSGNPVFDSEEKTWSMDGSIASAVTLEEDELVYNGKVLLPAVTVKLHGRVLVEGEDYTVSCPAPEQTDAEAENEEKTEPQEIKPVNVGVYALRIEAMGDYSGSYDTEFAIVEAEPVIKWSADTEAVTYTGSAAALHAKADVQTADGSAYKGEVTYAYRKAGTQDSFKNGLPVNVGEYEVKAAVAAFDNHTAAETEAPLHLTIAPRTVAPTVKVTADADALRYTGKEINPAVSVMDGSNVIPAAEYKVSYKDNTNVGDATVTVTAVEGGNYTFTGKVQTTFAIGKAQQAELTISGAPASVTYGDEAFTLSAEGGSTDAKVVWSVTEGSKNAVINKKGTLTVIGVGKVTVQAEKAGDANYEAATAQWSFEIARAPLTLVTAEASDKYFDGTKNVEIEWVQLSGIKNNDEVRVRVDDLVGQVESEKVGVYNKVKIVDAKLDGASAKYYQLTQPEDGIDATVEIKKKTLTAALESIEVKLPVGTENIVVENLGAGMPANAGALTFTNRTQSTGDGTQAIVLQWGVDAAGKLTAHVVNGKGGDRIVFEVAVASENYATAVVKVIVNIGAQAVDASKLTVTPVNSEIVYNGREQKPALTVKYENTVLTEGTDFDVKYPDDTVTAGEKEVTLTFKGSYEGTATAKYTVDKAKLTVSGTKVADKTYNGNTTATITAGTLNGVVQGDEVKLEAKGSFDDKNSGTKNIVVTYSLSGKAAANYTLEKETETLTAKINPIAAAQIGAGIGGLTTANATSDHRYALQTAINQANTALGDTGLSNAEKTNISNVKWNAESIISRLDSASAAAATANIRATANVNSGNVTVADKEALQKAKNDLSSALNTYGSNYTAAEEKAIKDKQTRIDSALLVITRVESASALINALPEDVENVDSGAVKDAQDSFNKLSEYEQTLIGDPLKHKLTAAGLAAGVEDELDTAPENTPQQNVSGVTPDEENADDNAKDEDTIELPMWIFWVAVLVAALIGLGFIWIKIKQRNEPNW